MIKSSPLYIQIADQLRKDIEEGRVKPLGRLGSQREFCDRFKVSPITVEWALRKLETDGVINRVRGRGTFVAGDALKRKVRSRRVAVVGHLETDWETNIYARTLYQTVQIEAQSKGLFIRFYERESDYADLLGQGEVDGAIILAPMLANVQQLRMLDPARHHYVIVAGDWGVAPTVLVDNRKGVTMAMNHLAHLGHTRIGLMTDTMDSTDVRHRHQAYVDYCKARGWPVTERRVMHRQDYQVIGPDEELAYQHFFDVREPPTAILAMGTHYAEDMIRILRARGVRVPEDVSVVGYDLPPHNRTLQRELTAIIQPLDRLAARALDLLIQKMDGHPVKDQTLLAPRLQIGKTTGPAPRQKARAKPEPARRSVRKA